MQGTGPRSRAKRFARRANAEVQQAATEALAEPMPSIESMFEDVYDQKPGHLAEQEREYLEFIVDRVGEE